jgi:hypothetical protein
MPGPSATAEPRAHTLPGCQRPAWPNRPLRGKECIRARPDHVAIDHDTPPYSWKRPESPTSECRFPGRPMSMGAATTNAAPAEFVWGEVKKGLQCTDFFLTMTSAYSSLIKYQRETLEKPNLPGRAFVWGFIFTIYSLNVFGDFGASAVRYFGNSGRVLCGFARAFGPRATSPDTLPSTADLEVVTP